MGVWGGPAQVLLFYLDIDVDGLGAGTGYSLCNGMNLAGWVLNLSLIHI